MEGIFNGANWLNHVLEAEYNVSIVSPGFTSHFWGNGRDNIIFLIFANNIFPKSDGKWDNSTVIINPRSLHPILNILVQIFWDMICKFMFMVELEIELTLFGRNSIQVQVANCFQSVIFKGWDQKFR